MNNTTPMPEHLEMANRSKETESVFNFLYDNGYMCYTNNYSTTCGIHFVQIALYKELVKDSIRITAYITQARTHMEIEPDVYIEFGIANVSDGSDYINLKARDAPTALDVKIHGIRTPRLTKEFLVGLEKKFESIVELFVG